MGHTGPRAGGPHGAQGWWATRGPGLVGPIAACDRREHVARLGDEPVVCMHMCAHMRMHAYRREHVARLGDEPVVAFKRATAAPYHDDARRDGSQDPDDERDDEEVVDRGVGVVHLHRVAHKKGRRDLDPRAQERCLGVEGRAVDRQSDLCVLYLEQRWQYLRGDRVIGANGGCEARRLQIAHDSWQLSCLAHAAQRIDCEEAARQLVVERLGVRIERGAAVAQVLEKHRDRVEGPRRDLVERRRRLHSVIVEVEVIVDDVGSREEAQEGHVAAVSKSVSQSGRGRGHGR